MSVALNQDILLLLLVFVVPGLISMHVYRLLIASRRIDWKAAPLEAFFYSVINLAIWYPLLKILHTDMYLLHHPLLYWGGMILIFLIGPVVWPYLYLKVITCRWLRKYLQLPHQSAWDWFFQRRQPVFMLIHLKNGGLIGGYYGKGSFATSYPNHGDLYISAVYKVTKKGEFCEPIKYTSGLLIRRDEYSYIELFRVPQTTPYKEASDGKRKQQQ